MSNYVLQMKGISKSYGSNQVLKGVDLEIQPGEIHCLIGENGAGKSTLMNILFGMEVIHATGGFEGQVFIDEKPVQINSPQAALAAHIGMVHQEFMLIPAFSIGENIKLNREKTNPTGLDKVFGSRLKSIDFDNMHSDSREALDTLGLDIDDYTRVAGLPVGHMQFVEIAREIDKTGLKILVFDEPTAVLAESEANNLLEAMRNLANQGIAILFITHRLDEVKEVGDNITVLRDGELVARRAVSETSVEEMAELMVGRAVELPDRSTRKAPTDEVLLELTDFSVAMPGEKVKNIHLSIKQGEILGIGGLAGQGKIGIANGIMGLYPASGTATLEGQELPLNNTLEILNSHIAFVSEDRRGVGLLLSDSIELNIAFTALRMQKKFLKRYGFFTQKDSRAITKHAKKMITDLDIRCTGPHQHTGRLSGGNQQKVCIARALTQDPKLLLVSEPTRGIDIGAKKLVLDLLVQLNQELDMTIVITSSELAELCSISDRIAIITEGKLAGVLPPDAPGAKFGLLMSGLTEEGEHLGGNQ